MTQLEVLTDAELEAVVGGKDFLTAFAGGMAEGGSGSGSPSRGPNYSNRGSASRAIAAVHRSVTSNFTNAVLGRR
ncbi:MAG TPA: hypothetical protein VMZ71_00470 [Gemmataceae bacterium]|nr:hypothetical protein [Gemmataceae bacterium]